MLVGTSVGCLMGCFQAPPLCPTTAPSKKAIKSGGASGDSLHGGASLKVEKAPFAKKTGLENRKNKVKFPPPPL